MTDRVTARPWGSAQLMRTVSQHAAKGINRREKKVSIPERWQERSVSVKGY